MQKFKKVEHYQLMEILGKGANGLVYKGLNTLNGSLVAVKQIFIGKSEVKAIKTQLDLLKRLDHPNIVKFIDAVQKQNKIYMVLQYMEGGSLSSLVRKSPLEQDVAKIYIKQILNGLAFLHKQQVIHRDIKGANILLTKNGFIKLADFGVAVRLQDNQKTISAAGSPYWMAPQIISPNGEQPSVKCDIWSLGCTIIQLLTGNPPYHDLMQFPALFRIVEDKHPPIPDCSSQCKQFLLSCFIKNPKERPSAEELLLNIWLRNATQISLYSVEIEDKIRQQISEYMKPSINYSQLQKILNRTKNSLIICSHKYFQMIIQDKRTPNIARLNLIVKLIANDQNSIIFLYKSGIISQQFDRLHQRGQLSDQQIKLNSQLIVNFIDIYCRKLAQQQIHFNVTQHHSQISSQTIENIILHKCVGGIARLLNILSKDRKSQYKMAILKGLNKFLDEIEDKKNSNQKRQIFVQIVLELEQTCALKQIILMSNVNNSPNGNAKMNKQRETPNQIKLELLQKIVIYFNYINEIKPTFRKYICFTVAQLLKIQSVNSEGYDSIDFSIFVCLSAFTENDFCRSELQRNGVIFYLCSYYKKIAENKIVFNISALQSSLNLLIKFVENDKAGIDLNRILQFQRNYGNKYLKFIYDSFKSQGKNKKKQQFQASVSEKILQILALNQKLSKQ